MDVADSDVIAREADLIIRIIKRKGHPLQEEEYESQLAKHRMKVAKLPRIQIRRDDKYYVPSKAMQKPEESDPVRVGAEIMLIMGGNREGVLDAFTIHAVPGYNFKMINANFSTEEVKQWVSEDDEEATKGAEGEKKFQTKSVDTKALNSNAFKSMVKAPKKAFKA